MTALKGITQWFDRKKGWGFIDVDGIAYFVHYKSIKMAGHKELLPGQHVMFIGEQGEKGWYATDIILIKDAEKGS